MKKVVIALSLALAVCLSMSTLALALDAPTSISIESVKAFRNLVETGDMAVMFHYKIPYGTYPTTPATNSIIFRLYAADGSTLLATARPYVLSVFETNGYGDGVSGFYFDSTDAPTWESALQINILGVPAYFDPPQTFTYIMTEADYSTATLETDAQTDMYNFVIGLATTFASIYADYPLKSSTDSGVCLSIWGEAYFRGALPGIQAMCPELFSVQTYTPEKMTVVTYNMSLGESYASRLLGSDLMRGADRLGTHIGGMSGYFVFGIATFIGCIALCVVCMRKGWGLEPGMVASVFIVILMAVLLGDLMFTMVMIGGLVAAMGIMFVLLLKRA